MNTENINALINFLEGTGELVKNLDISENNLKY